jgi:hypothetical protein
MLLKIATLQHIQMIPHNSFIFLTSKQHPRILSGFMALCLMGPSGHVSKSSSNLQNITEVLKFCSVNSYKISFSPGESS